MTLFYWGMSLIGALALSGIIWRVAHGRHPIPCPVWLGWLVEMDNPLARTNSAAAIIEHIHLSSGMRLLDAGCGPGRVSIPAARCVGVEGEVVALDLQAGMLHRAEKRSRSAGISNIRFVQAGLGEGKLEQNYFDRILLVTVLGEIGKREEAMREIYAALKTGGIFSVTEIIFDPHYTRREKVTGLCTTVGFQEKEYYGNWVSFTLNFEKPQ